MVYELFRLIVFYTNFNFGQSIISGKIHNCKKKEISINYDLYNLVSNSNKLIKLNPDNDGNFIVKINDIRYLSTVNWIKVGHKFIYFCIEPNDSLFIEFDFKNINDVSFRGVKSTHSVFINDYYHRIMSRQNASSSLRDTFTHYYTLDSLFLAHYKRENLLDSSFVIFYNQVLRYEFFNSLTTLSIDNSKYYKLVARDFNLNNEDLKYYLMYYSAIQGYMINMIDFKFNPLKFEDLKWSFEFTDKTLASPFNDIYKAYLIGYFYMAPYRSKIKKSREMRDFINSFIFQCKDKIVKEELLQMLKDRNIEI